MTTREAFLDGVRREMARLGGLPSATPGARPPDPVTAAAVVRERARGDWERLLARFRAEAERVGTIFHRVPTVEAAGEVVLGLAQARGARRVASWARRRLGVVAEVASGLVRAGLEVLEASPEELPDAARDRLRALVAEADLGLTTADLAIAETGSLVLASGVGKGRSVSLLPPCHVAVLGRAELVPGLAEAGVVLEAWHAAPRLDAGANIVFVTGPSRTADIELTLIRGVHGPREVHAVFVDAL